MRICLFTPVFLPDVGGTEVVTDALARHLRIAGHDAHVLAMGQPADLDVPYPVHWYAKPRAPHWFPERIGAALAGLHERVRFDAILVNYGVPTGYAAVRRREALGVPVILVSHGGDLFRDAPCRKRPHLWRRVGHAYRNADAVVAISSYVESLIREVAPSVPRLERIGNGIDADALRAPALRPRDFPGRRPFALCLGNLGRQKGFEHAVAAFAGATLEGMDLLIVGDGPRRAALRQQVASLALNDRVHFLGRRTGNDKRWFLQHCAFGLMPSLEEGHPIVGLEFLAVGKPVICTTNAAFDDLFEHEVNALRVEAQRPAALGRAMVRMAASDLDAMGSRSAQRADRFTWPAVAARYVALMQSLASEAGG